MIKHMTRFCILMLLTSCTNYSSQKDGVYYGSWNEARGKTEILVEGADPKTFEEIEDDYGRDEKSVFHKSSVIPGADPNTFRIIQDGYAIDKDKIYYYGDSVANSSSKSFEILDPYFSKDNQDVYFRTRPLGVKDLKEFKFLTNNSLNNRWSTDGHFYWFNNFKVPSNSYDDVVLLENDAGFSRDNWNVYYLDRNIKFNSEGERILDTLDIETFKIERHIDCRDKFGCINVFHGREHCE